MKKILVFEDSEGDLSDRYAFFARKGLEVHVKFFPDPYAFGPLEDELLQMRGFNPDYVEQVDGIEDLDFSELQDYDLYALDSLEGKCFDVLEQLPKERCYIQSMNTNVQEDAVDKGYQLLGHEIHELIAKIILKTSVFSPNLFKVLKFQI